MKYNFKPGTNVHPLTALGNNIAWYEKILFWLRYSVAERLEKVERVNEGQGKLMIVEDQF